MRKKILFQLKPSLGCGWNQFINAVKAQVSISDLLANVDGYQKRFQRGTNLSQRNPLLNMKNQSADAGFFVDFSNAFSREGTSMRSTSPCFFHSSPSKCSSSD
ncbi:hypothetical protein M514_11954, partial [Trichuris suis]